MNMVTLLSWFWIIYYLFLIATLGTAIFNRQRSSKLTEDYYLETVNPAKQADLFVGDGH